MSEDQTKEMPVAVEGEDLTANAAANVEAQAAPSEDQAAPESQENSPGVDSFEIPLSGEPVNHVQSEDNYELPQINPERITPMDDEPAADQPEQTTVMDIESMTAALRALTLGHPRDTTGYEVDAAVELFLSSDDKYGAGLKNLKYRLGCLAAEATNHDVARTIAEILKVVE